MRKFKLFITICSLFFIFNLADRANAGSLPNGAECHRAPADASISRSIRLNCKSNYCMPGPSSQNELVKWYCTDAKNHCAFPGSNGYRDGTQKWYNGKQYNCQRKVPKGWARFRKMR